MQGALFPPRSLPVGELHFCIVNCRHSPSGSRRGIAFSLSWIVHLSLALNSLGSATPWLRDGNIWLSSDRYPGQTPPQHPRLYIRLCGFGSTLSLYPIPCHCHAGCLIILKWTSHSCSAQADILFAQLIFPQRGASLMDGVMN